MGRGTALLIGNDRVLLQSRCDILKHFGYRARVHITDRLFALPLLGDVSLVHICQTVEPEPAADLARRIRALHPDIVILYTEKRRQPEPDDFDELLPPLMHPEAYLEVVSSFLKYRV